MILFPLLFKEKNNRLLQAYPFSLYSGLQPTTLPLRYLSSFEDDAIHNREGEKTTTTQEKTHKTLQVLSDRTMSQAR